MIRGELPAGACGKKIEKPADEQPSGAMALIYEAVAAKGIIAPRGYYSNEEIILTKMGKRTVIGDSVEAQTLAKLLCSSKIRNNIEVEWHEFYETCDPETLFDYLNLFLILSNHELVTLPHPNSKLPFKTIVHMLAAANPSNSIIWCQRTPNLSKFDGAAWHRSVIEERIAAATAFRESLTLAPADLWEQININLYILGRKCNTASHKWAKGTEAARASLWKVVLDCYDAFDAEVLLCLEYHTNANKGSGRTRAPNTVYRTKAWRNAYLGYILHPFDSALKEPEVWAKFCQIPDVHKVGVQASKLLAKYQVYGKSAISEAADITRDFFTSKANKALKDAPKPAEGEVVMSGTLAIPIEPDDIEGLDSEKMSSSDSEDNKGHLRFEDDD